MFGGEGEHRSWARDYGPGDTEEDNYEYCILNTPEAIDLKHVKINLSNEMFPENLKQKTKRFDSEQEKVNVEIWPSLLTLAELALAVYEKGGKLRSEEEKAGWEVLSFATSSSIKDGYFGAVYINRAQQQLVLAHRGTELSDLGAMYTNKKSVVDNEITPRMNSAITFADELIAALKKCHCQNPGIRFHLSMTGHSLGGWLAQVTAFWVKYILIENGVIKMNNGREGCHVRTVVFDSPGCEPMLSKLKRDLGLRYQGTMKLKKLDITSVLSAPNRINTCNMHVGMVYRIKIDLSDMTFWAKHFPLYNLATHKMNKIATALRNEASSKIWRALDWPLSYGVSGGREYKQVFERAKYNNSYHPESAGRVQLGDHYYTEEVLEDECSLRIFSDEELDLLKAFVNLNNRDNPLTELNEFLSGYGFKDDIVDLFRKTTINNYILKCTSKESLDKIVRCVKALSRWWLSEAEVTVRKQLELIPSAGEYLWQQESKRLLSSLSRIPNFSGCKYTILNDVLTLADFINSSSTRILLVETSDITFELSRLQSLLTATKNIENGKDKSNEGQLFLNWKQLQTLQKFTNVEILLKSENVFNGLLVLSYELCSDITEKEKHLLNLLVDSYKRNPSKKLIILTEDKSSFLQPLEKPLLDDISIDISVQDLKFSDFTTEAREHLVSQKNILLHEKLWSIQDILGMEQAANETVMNNLLDAGTLKQMLFNNKLEIDLGGYLPNFHNIDVAYTKVNRESSIEELKCTILAKNWYLVVSGLSPAIKKSDQWAWISDENMRFTEDTSEETGVDMFRSVCREQEKRTVLWVQLTGAHIQWKRLYDLDFYINRTFRNKIFINLSELEFNLRDIYVFKNVSDRALLDNFLDSFNIKIKSKAYIHDPQTPDRPTHFFEIEGIDTNVPRVVWKSSTKSMNGLRSACIYSKDSKDSVDEKDLCSTSRLVVLEGEPGMGKSTTLTTISELMVTNSSWVIRIDLGRHQSAIRNLSFDLNDEDVVKFLLFEKIDSLKCKLFKQCLKTTESKQIQILFDGFDEIKEEYAGHVIKKCAQEKVVNLLKYLKNKTFANISVTTRPFPCKLLENELSVFATKFNKITEGEHRQFTEKFWSAHLVEDPPSDLLQRYSSALLKGARSLLGVDIDDFMRIPLQMHMLAEAFVPRVRRLLTEQRSIESSALDNVFHCNGLLDLYEIFITSKYNIYLGEKSDLSSRLTKVSRGWLESFLTKRYRKLGFLQLFPNDTEFLGNFQITKDELIELNRSGVIQLNGDYDWEFLHPTFAEYYTADLVTYRLLKERESVSEPPLSELLMAVVLMEDNFKVVRKFMNDQLTKHKNSWTENAWKRNVADIKMLWLNKRHLLVDNQYRTALHIAVEEKNIGIIKFLLEIMCSKEEGLSQLVDFVAARDQRADTALLLAAPRPKSEDSSAPLPKNEDSPAPDEDVFNVLLSCLENYSEKDKRYIIMSTIYRSFQNEGDKNIENFLNALPSQWDNYINDIWDEKLKSVKDFHRAAESNNLFTLQKMLDNRKDEAERRWLLLATNRAAGDLTGKPKDIRKGIGSTALHLAAGNGHVAAVTFLIKQGIPIDIADNTGMTPLMTAAIRDSNCEVAKYLLQKGANPSHRDIYGMSVLAWSAKCGNLDLFNYLISEHKVDWTISDENRISPFHHAAKSGHLPIVEELLKFGAVLDGKDLFGKTALAWAAGEGMLDTVKYLAEQGADLNSPDRYGVSVLMVVIKAAKWDVGYWLVEQGADLLHICMKKDTALLRAARAGKWDFVEFLRDKKVEYPGEASLKSLSEFQTKKLKGIFKVTD